MRLAKLKEKLLQENLDACLISSIPNIIYLTNFSGFSNQEREGWLLLTKKANYLFTDARLSGEANKIPHFELLEISAQTKLIDWLTKVVNKHGLKALGIEANNLNVTEYRILQALVGKTKLRTLVDFNLFSLRSTKQDQEIAEIKQACKLTDLAFKQILGKIKPGTTEQELAWQLELFIRSHHADLAFTPIVAFGKNSAVPHHQTGKTKLQAVDSVLLDFGVKLNSYCSDMTRTVFVGKITNQQRKIYQTVLAAQTQAFAYLKNHCHSECSYVPDGTCRNQESRSFDFKSQDDRCASKVDQVARDYLAQQGFPSLPHSLGHGVGLEVHEAPSLSPNSHELLETGMVFTLEPGIYLSDLGGVRIEDVVSLTNNKPNYLTSSSKGIIVL